jgi:hypothetical protein
MRAPGEAVVLVSGRLRGRESGRQIGEEGVCSGCSGWSRWSGGRVRSCSRVAPYRTRCRLVQPRARRSLDERFYNSVSRRRIIGFGLLVLAIGMWNT